MNASSNRSHIGSGSRKILYRRLAKEDYYSEKQEIIGQWFGQAAERLGLSGDVTQEAFAALVENKNPVTGQRLTARTNAERRVGYDLNFHAPKSLSILHALTGDKALVDAFRSAVAETMREIELSAATRVRRGKADTERLTGNLVWGEFVHFTARPVAGVADPHLHVHCFAMNCTYDDVESRWKAASWKGIKREAPYHEAAFHARLADKIGALGYAVERTPRGWEISGISRELIQRFSRRGAEIERIAAEKGITNPKAKDALGKATRESKRHGVSNLELVAEWKSRLTDKEAAMIADLAAKKSPVPVRPTVQAGQALDYATGKLFARDSVVRVNAVIEEALRYGVGGLTPAAAWAEFERRDMIVRQVEGEWLCTTRAIVAEEVSLINYVRTGRETLAPIVTGPLLQTDISFTREERAALRHILKSNDQVMVIQGKAGVGKTTLMIEAARQIEATGARP